MNSNSSWHVVSVLCTIISTISSLPIKNHFKWRSGVMKRGLLRTPEWRWTCWSADPLSVSRLTAVLMLHCLQPVVIWCSSQKQATLMSFKSRRPPVPVSWASCHVIRTSRSGLIPINIIMRGFALNYLTAQCVCVCEAWLYWGHWRQLAASVCGTSAPVF